MNLNIFNDKIVLDIIDYDNIKLSNSKSGYIFLPVIYTCEAKESNHMAILFIDTKVQQALIIDPNGKPNYFDNVMEMNICDKIEAVFTNYFETFNIKFIKTDQWIQKKFCINRRFDEFEISSGHCAIISIMICNLIIATKKLIKFIKYDEYNDKRRTGIHNKGIYNWMF